MNTIEARYPLSPMQQGMLFHNSFDDQPGYYIEQVVCHFRESIQVSLLIQSWKQVLERTPVLRTSFNLDDPSQLQQIVHRQVELPFVQQDWQNLSKTDQCEKLAGYLRHDRRRGFRTEEIPLMRLALFQRNEADYTLVWTFYHALLDGRSITTVLQEVFSLYDAYSLNQICPLPQRRPYKDYIDWLQAQSFETAKTFWQKRLRGFTAPTQLPTLSHNSLKSGHGDPLARISSFGADSNFSASTHTVTPRYGYQTIQLPPELTAALAAFAQVHDLTLSTLVQAAWALLLHRYSGESDVVFGATRACRHSSIEKAEEMVGLFINTLPIRTQVSDDTELLPWLHSLRNQWVSLRNFEHTPLSKVQEWSDVCSGTPLFQSLLMFDHADLNDSVCSQGSDWTSRECELLSYTNYPLALTAYGGECLALKIKVDGYKFDDVTVSRMLAHLERLLQEFLQNPKGRVVNLPLLTARERHQLLVEWNDTQTAYSQHKCVHELFEEQVERTPGAVAVVFEDQQLTYRELNARANQLAHYLRSLGVKPEVLVGICIDRSLEMIVELLAILKAGGAYVPIDPDYPVERKRFILSDTGLQVLLGSEKSLAELATSNSNVAMVCLDRDGELICDQSETNPLSGSVAGNLAYVIYTSGSTGQPKGVMIEHRSVLNLATALNQAVYTEGDDSKRTVSLNGSVAFDTSVKQIIQLLEGNALNIVPQELRFDGSALLGYLARHEIDVFDCTPSQLRLLIEAGLLSDSAFIPQYVLVGGEPIDESTWQKLRTVEKKSFYNLYGPTECTVDATVCRLELSHEQPVIGRPLANTELYILDQYLQPVPIGVPGELYIGGDGLARGYLNRPELTQETFTPNSFSEKGGAHLYKTGDYARYLPDGNVEFLGRLDSQVKIRGFRIELGEIESVLSIHPQIQQVVVIAREDIPGDKRLVAYIVASNELLSSDQLREFVKQRLPEYMSPSAFVTLDKLPLTANGKIDHQVLPPPELESIREDDEFIAPRTPSEEIIAGVFAAVLKRERVGIHDNFFELGGHSLLATQLVSRVRQTLAVELPLRTVFSSPTVAELDKTITELRTTQTALALPPVQPRTQSKQVPPSYAQERLWFLSQHEGLSATYNMQRTIRVNGSLDINALQHALSEIVRRHEVLRTSFPTLNGTPIQVIHPTASLSIKLVDLQQLEASEREAVYYQQAQEEAIAPFDLEIAPLIKCSLLQLDVTEYALLLTMHHIVFDGWSSGILVKELSSLYQAFSSGEPSPLAELSLQYADFAVWQRQWLRGGILETQLNYWKQQLEGAPDLLQLPTDHPRPAVQTYRGKTRRFRLSTDLTRKLQTLSRNSCTTLFMTLQAAYATLLYRYSGQSDILIGSPIANRNRSEIESLIGVFINTLVLRVSLENSPRFSDLLAQVRETTLCAYEHQDIGFEQVVEAIQPQRSTSHSPLFQVMFVLQNAPAGELRFSGCTWRELNLEITTAKFDLTLSITESDQELVGSWEYNTDLFEDITIERMGAHFETLLSAIVENPQRSVHALPLLSKAERHQLLTEWNDTGSEYPRDKCIHQLFEEQVGRLPDAVAVVFENEQLTYRQLNQRANRLARHLTSLGVGSEALVGVCLERSPQMVTALLGILKAGAAYVPLDPAYPRERLAFMMKETQIKVLLTQTSLMENLPPHTAQVVCMDSDAEAIDRESEISLSNSVTVKNLAYVMYTSGSTGKPKGVSVIHRGVVRLVKETNYAEFSAEEVFLQLAPISFDASTMEIWGSLLNGGRLIIFARQTPSTEELGAAIRNNGVTTLWLTAALFHLMVDERLQDLKPLRQLLAGGDVLSVPHVEKVLRELDCQLINGYGPTENTTFTCCYPVARDKQIERTVSIGRPIANTQVYVLDKTLEPVPVGVQGELYIGGDGLARGYFKRPQLTREKFIPNPFMTSQSGMGNEERLYKTGDQVRYLPDGNIEFLGRIDNQVKLRGFRIELGEIESVLSSHERTQQALVIVREDVPGDKRLVAYVVPSDESLTGGQLRQFLKQKLPEYMVPSALVLLEALPLTPNGKVDHRALPAPQGELIREHDDVVPRTHSEEILANLFATVLKLDKVGIHDNFFELGGHSLLATQLVSRVRQALTLELPLSTVFSSPTVASLNQTITELRATQSGLTPLPAVKPQPGDGAELPLSWAQERLWFIDQLESASATYNIPIALSLVGKVNVVGLEKALAEIVRRHEILRTGFPSEEGKPIQVINPEADLVLDVVDLPRNEESERSTQLQQLLRQEISKPFDLARGPLIRANLWPLSSSEYVLLINIHHIVADGWSINVLEKEISALYKAFVRGEPYPLPESALQYKDFALWQREWASEEFTKNQLTYWKEQLRGAPELLQLPTDRPRPNIQTFQGGEFPFSLSTQLSHKLKNLSTRSGTTIFMTLLGALATLLYRLSGQPDIVIGSPVANRNRREIENLIGFFANTLVLRTRLEKNPSFEDLLTQVRETTLNAYEHQDLGFEQIVEALQPERCLSHAPLFQVMFVLKNTANGELELPGVTVRLLKPNTGVAKFDLTLSMKEAESGLMGSWNYNSNLFDGETIERMAGHFQTLLSAIVDNPLQKVGDIPLLNQAQRHQLLVEWNQTESEYPRDKCIHQLFEEQVKQTPGAVAVLSGNQQLTYLQLNQKANQLARHLQILGVKPEVLVGVCVERSVEMVVGLLGILKAIPLPTSQRGQSHRVLDTLRRIC